MKIIKKNINKVLFNLLMIFSTKKIFYKNANK